MTQAVHIISKDLRRLRWLLFVWIAILAARVAFWSLGTSASGSIGDRFLLEQTTSIMGSLQMLMLAFVAARLVHEEPLVGWNAFWFTRPYSRNALMAAKLLSAAVMLVALPLLADLLTMSMYHAGVRAQAAAGATFVSGYITWTLLVLALAAVTPSLGAFVLTIVAGIAGLSLLLAAAVAVAVFLTEPSTVTPSMEYDPTPSLLANSAFVATMVGVIVYQYRHRRWQTAVALAAAGLVATLAVPSLWPSRRPAITDPGEWSKNPVTTPVAVDRRWHVQVNDRVGLRQGSPKRQVYARVALAGMPRDFTIESVDVESALTMADGRTVRSHQMDSFNPPVEGEEWPGSLAATRAALGDVALIRGMNEGNFEHWPALITLDGQEYQRLRGQSGQLTATLRFHLNQTRLRAALPLEAGAAHDDGLSRFEILRSERGPDGLIVAVRQWRAFSPTANRFHGTAVTFVLRNASRREALSRAGQTSLPTPQSGTGVLVRGPVVVSLLGSMSVGMSRDGFAIVSEQLRYPDRIARPGESRTFDGSWFDGADLAVLESGYAGTVTRSVTIDDFVIPAD